MMTNFFGINHTHIYLYISQTTQILCLGENISPQGKQFGSQLFYLHSV